MMEKIKFFLTHLNQTNPKYLFIRLFTLSILGMLSFLASYLLINALDTQFHISEKILPQRSPSSSNSITDSLVKVRCGKFLCSGSIIGKNKILSAAHCFKKTSKPQDCKVEHRSQSYKITKYRSEARVGKNEQTEVSKDWIVLKLGRNLPHVKHFKLFNNLKIDLNRKVYCDEMYPVKQIHYSVKQRSFILNEKCIISKIKEGAIYHNCSQEGGSSGSAIFVEDNNDWYILGVHSKSPETGFGHSEATDIREHTNQILSF